MGTSRLEGNKALKDGSLTWKIYQLKRKEFERITGDVYG